MTKKHFIALADVIKAENDRVDGYDRNKFTNYQIKILADFCEIQNPMFDRERWVSYIAGTCGKSGGKVKCES